MHSSHGEFSLNKSFATFMGGLLILRGLLGFMSPEKLFGLLSNSPDHNFIHVLAGMCLLWAGVWGRRTTARAWNKFLGWVYLVIAFFGIAGVQFLMDHMNVNTWADNCFNLFVALSCLLIGHFGTRIRQRGMDFMQAGNFPYGKT